MKILLVVVGARPNFMKVARFREVAAIRGDFGIEVVHTGQQSDDRMTTVFLDQFQIEPDHWLGIGPGDPHEQIAHIMLGLGPVIKQVAPVGMVVVGDVTSTLAAALTANKMGIPLIHLESGLRSGDLRMPEEVNRILTDRITDHFLITEPSAREHLLNEGTPPERIHFVGNTMIDTLVAFQDRIATDPILATQGWEGGHALITMHRPAAVDDPVAANRTVDMIEAVAKRHRSIFPIHPRTRSRLQANGLLDRLSSIPNLHLASPLDYFAFQRVLATSTFVVTDSGGVQEETTYRGIPCLTLRPNTERPITLEIGTNELVPFDVASLNAAMTRIMDGSFKKGRCPELWDGHATERVFEVLSRTL
ncbi:MAG: UDP-N-acetylglucosamine 2-epimerase (non-hydrolyzing) [Flavobacteriales bacterium]|jgi:UDP-N-acetylglucosamine 2-epimerase (non-hydrolysing)|nr:UDP-N-acetylglucosamine 2-epimerase (non-hydrolyzing) [Flavobacteriales bacterium]MBK6882601.1 UDP-N-acetylglucosamine 2-epimerase (non-hydrolyzing) [Flavobacteriales bacterium]MBK7111888.1 UDP-N-acetylglucosamine 2-epimerase (non-hydrolyzing) [Flavobacteriales bacterium]MBK7482110.1 UDP-N-acetylglucosamine 2-epimerase (non-hydrolyzing) [Flavobacteriales bacterium]MBK7619082.1 UDP-N-acetylglucosamine 2-epimerase (non-hydrolyzing) [Flavobacteriales bacterium]